MLTIHDFLSSIFTCLLVIVNITSRPTDFSGVEELGAVQAVVSSQSLYGCPMLLLFNDARQISPGFLKVCMTLDGNPT